MPSPSKRPALLVNPNSNSQILKVYPPQPTFNQQSLESLYQTKSLQSSQLKTKITLLLVFELSIKNLVTEPTDEHKSQASHSRVCSNPAMNLDSPPLSDECPELTPDNGTPTSSTPGSANLAGVNRQDETDANNNQVHENALGIFENNNRPASTSGLNNNVEQNNIPARVPPTGGFHYSRSPYPIPTAPPPIDLSGLERMEAIPYLSIGPPVLPLPRNPWSPRPRSDSESAVRFADEPTVIPNTPPRSPEPSPGISSYVSQELQGLIDFFIILFWVVKSSRGNSD